MCTTRTKFLRRFWKACQLAVKYTESAKADLHGILSYIARDNPFAARKVIQAIRDQVNVLSDQAVIGRSGRIDGTRELVIHGLPYVVCYAVTDKTITVLRVLHGRQRWPDEV